MKIDYAKLFNVDEFSIETDLTGKYYKGVVKQGFFIWNEPQYREYPLSIARWSINGQRCCLVVPYEEEKDMFDYIQRAIEFSRGNNNASN